MKMNFEFLETTVYLFFFLILQNFRTGVCIHTLGAHVESQKSWLHKKCSSQVRVSSAFPPIMMMNNITQLRIDIFKK